MTHGMLDSGAQVVAAGDRATALKIYPDPRLVLGPLW